LPFTTNEPGLDCISIVSEGNELLSIIEKLHPDIVVCDVDLAGLDSFEIMRRAHEYRSRTHFILASEKLDSDVVYKAMKSSADDILVRPFESAELLIAIRNVEGTIRRQNKERSNSIYSASKNTYLYKAIPYLIGGKDTLEEINQTYGTVFCEGLFRIIFVKFDNSRKKVLDSEGAFALHDIIDEIIAGRFQAVCREVLYVPKDDGLELLLNYTEEHEKEMLEGLPGLQKKLKEFTDIHITINVGGAYSDHRDIIRSHKEAFAASWSRWAKGLDTIIFWEEPEDALPRPYDQKLTQLKMRLIAACEVLDIDEFRQCLVEFFSMPISIVVRPEVRSTLRDISDYIFDIDGMLLNTNVDLDEMKQQILYMLHMSETAEKYKINFETQFSRFLEQIAEKTNIKSKQPIRQAIGYIKNNYDKQIDLETVAKKVYLSPSYLSSIFKRETGQNFSDYVTTYRMEIAKNLLASTKQPITDIARLVSYANQTYFSKTFKKFVGVMPTEYRKIHG